MKKYIHPFFFQILVLLIVSCNHYKQAFQIPQLKDGTYFRATVKKLSDVIVRDIFSPPVASRIYAYPNIAAYECLIPSNDKFITLAGQLKGLKDVPKPVNIQTCNYEIASLKAFITVGKTLIHSGGMLSDYEKELFDKIKNEGISQEVLNVSIDYGTTVANHIIEWANNDNYNQTRTFPKYESANKNSSWTHTPPDYMD